MDFIPNPSKLFQLCIIYIKIITKREKEKSNKKIFKQEKKENADLRQNPDGENHNPRG